MDIRQIVMVSSLRDPIVSDLCNLFECKVAFNDPGVSHFGLENAVIPIGTDFLEVVSPVKTNTTAGRYLKKRDGDGGYMIIIQVDEFANSKDLVLENKINIVWETDLPDAKAIHLHPKQMGGAILSLDWMNPKASWKWAGPNWEEYISGPVKGVNGAEIQSDNPQSMFDDWRKIFPNQRLDLENLIIYFDNTFICFKFDEDGRGPGISSFTLGVDNPENIYRRANDLGLVKNETIIIGGVKFNLI